MKNCCFLTMLQIFPVKDGFKKAFFLVLSDINFHIWEPEKVKKLHEWVWFETYPLFWAPGL